jgi:rod shape-determining protein MreB and related proteins
LVLRFCVGELFSICQGLAKLHRFKARAEVIAHLFQAQSFHSQGFFQMAFKSIFSLFSSDLAIDLGTANTLVYAKGRGIVVSEPSIVAINKVTNAVEAVGRDAKEMLGRTPGNIVAIRPMKDGVIANFEVTEKMLQHFIRKAHNGKTWVSPRVVIGIPSEITQVERRAVEDSAYRAKASEVYLVEEAMAAAIGAGLPITEAFGNMIVDIGGGTTDIAVISLSGIVYSKSVRVAGNEMDEAITQYIKRKYNLLIGERTAEAIKIELGSAFPLDEELSFEVRGRNLIEGIPKTITITDEEIREALGDSVSTIINAVRVALERTPPELSADIVERGIVLTGGGALLKNLDKRLSIETGLPVSLAEDPLASVVLGTGKMLSDFDLLKRVKWDNSLTSGT